MVFLRSTKGVPGDTKGYVFQCLVILLHVTALFSASEAQSDTRKLHLLAKFNVVGLPTLPLFRLIKDPSPVQSKMMDFFSGVTSLRNVIINGIRPSRGRISVNWTLEFSESVTPRIREEVALVVLDLEERTNITVQNTTLPFDLELGVGIFDSPPGSLDDMQSQGDAIDWCSSPALHDCREGGVCTDTGLRYTCPCGEGLADNGTHCLAKVEPKVEVTFNINPTGIDFNNSSSRGYTNLQREISELLFARLSGNISGLEAVVVERLSRGSVIAYCRLEMNTTGQRSDVTAAIINLQGQTITLMGQDTQITLQIPSAGGAIENQCDAHKFFYPDFCDDKICQLIKGEPECICLPGYKNKSEANTTCVDVDECKEDCHCCDQLCTNTIGSFTCDCELGFVLNPDGRTCNDTNECSTNPDICEQTCVNTNGSYTCYCDPGFAVRSDGTCADIDECASNSDDCEQTCINTVGSYYCSCRADHILNSDGRTCSRISCGGARAGVFGTIESPGYSSQPFVGSRADCQKKDDFYCRLHYNTISDGCFSECIWTITTAPGTAIRLTVDDIDINHLYCCTHNLEILDGAYRTSKRIAQLCGTNAPKPFISTGNSLYIRLNADADSRSPTNGFRASWKTVCPDQMRFEEEGRIQSPGFPGSYPPNLDCTYVIDPPVGYAVELIKERFQLDANCGDFLEVNGKRFCDITDKDFQSLSNDPGPVLIRFQSDNDSSSSRVGFSIQFRRQKKTGARSIPSTKFCKEWYKKNDALKDAHSAGFRQLPPCPCTQWRTMAAFGFVKPNENSKCFGLSQMIGKAVQPYGKLCCYATLHPFGELTLARNLAYNPNIPAYKSKYDQEEARASRDCKAEYDELRPDLKGACLNGNFRGNEMPLVDATSWGEPHIITLDKAEYTFNGWGEYILVRVTSDDTNFILQGRTHPFQIGPDNYVNATVFTAFGAREGAATVFVELDPDTKTSLVVYGNGRDLTLPFREDPAFTWDTEDFLLQKRNDTLQAAFPSGIGIRVSVRLETLAISVSMPLTFSNKTQGLLGNFNGEKNDDFVLPNGTVLSSNMTEREIYQRYGMEWAVTEADSVMRYGPREGPADYAHPDFIPVFLDEQPRDVIQAAEQQCQADNLACIYDYVATGNRELALDSETVQEEADKIAVLEKNNAPFIEAPSTVRVSPNVRTYFALQGYDYDNETVTFHADNDADGHLQLDPATGNVSYRLTGADPPRLSFYTEDPKGVRSVSKDILLLICACGPNGRCVFPNTTLEASENKYFQYVQCECSTGYDGEKCDQDRDGCKDGPCLPGQNCTDLSPAEERRRSVGYDCGPCPRGYTASSTSSTGCRDIDECSDSQVNQCSHVCNNTAGSFHCGCRSGYQLNNDGRTCLDVNECAEKLDGCPQNCRNTVGGFECVCEDGYNYNQANNSCTADVSTASLCRNAGCSQGCKPTSGGRTPQCFCFAGYEVDSTDPRNCVDRDECQSNLCSQRCSNTQGSFTCSCHSGFQLNQDQRTCTRCPELRYGLDCSQTCNCSGRGLGCHPVTGCVCPGGWTGEQCEQDVDECTESPELCGADRDCANTEGSYACECPLGYTLDDSDQCQDFDECAENYHTCSPDENCVNVPGGFNCTCKPGYHRERDSCVDIDECAQPWSNKCEQECVNVPGSFNCLCLFRYKLASDRLSCLAETDLCKLQSGRSMDCQFGCGIADDDSVYCLSPPPGFRYDNTTQQFVDIDECQNASSCSHTCSNTEGSFNCSCPAGMYLDNDRRTCLTCPAGTYGIDCSQQCNCGRGAARCDVIRGCVCAAGWTGSNCEVDRNECADESVRRTCGSHGTCVNTPGSYRCQCNAGYTAGSGVPCEDIDECESSPCDQQCENSLGSYRCLCSRGFILNNATGLCEDVDECGSDSLNNCDQSCLNNPGSYVCACDREGYYLSDDGVSCIDIDECQNASRCSHTCSNTEGSFNCSCPVGMYLDNDRRTCLTQSPQCGGRWMALSGTLQSPNFPNAYNNSLDCDYLITVPNNYNITLHVTTFDLENSYDFLTIRDGGSEASPQFGRYTGALSPFTLVSSQGQMWIKFYTDGSATRSGFSATYTTAQSPRCGGRWMALSGTLQSPNFPSPYNNFLDCDYLIIAPQNFYITLNFTTFDLENGADFLTVRDGGSEASPQFGRYTGALSPFTLVSSQGQMWINFYTDGSATRSGFSATYTTGCGRNWTSLTGTLRSPNFPSYYTNNLDCSHVIIAPATYHVWFTFRAFDLESCCDYVEIRDGGHAGSPSLGRFHNMTTPFIITSTGNQMWILFHTDSSVVRTGFNATYISVP